MPVAHIAEGGLGGGPMYPLKGEHLGQTDRLYNLVMDRIKLQMETVDEARARAIIATDYSADPDVGGLCPSAGSAPRADEPVRGESRLGVTGNDAI